DHSDRLDAALNEPATNQVDVMYRLADRFVQAAHVPRGEGLPGVACPARGARAVEGQDRHDDVEAELEPLRGHELLRVDPWPAHREAVERGHGTARPTGVPPALQGNTRVLDATRPRLARMERLVLCRELVDDDLAVRDVASIEDPHRAGCRRT